MSNHLMIDIETLGTSSDSIVLSVSGCIFNIDSLQFKNEIENISFNEYLNIYEQELINRKVDLGTLNWWISYQEKVSPNLKEFLSKKDFTPLSISLNNINEFIKKNNVTTFWANGPDFDISILRSLYNDCNIPFLINYSKTADVRTIKLIRSVLNMSKFEASNKNKHNSLSDAINQALFVNETLIDIKLRYILNQKKDGNDSEVSNLDLIIDIDSWGEL